MTNRSTAGRSSQRRANRGSHRDQSAPIASLIQWRASVDLVRQRLASCGRAAGAVAIWVAALNHKPAYYSMKDGAVIKASLREKAKILCSLWSLVLEQLKFDFA